MLVPRCDSSHRGFSLKWSKKSVTLRLTGVRHRATGRAMRTNEPNTVTLTIRVLESVKHSLQEKAKADDLTLSQLVRRQLAAAAAATITVPKPDKKA